MNMHANDLPIGSLRDSGTAAVEPANSTSVVQCTYEIAKCDGHKKYGFFFAPSGECSLSPIIFATVLVEIDTTFAPPQLFQDPMSSFAAREDIPKTQNGPVRMNFVRFTIDRNNLSPLQRSMPG